MRKVWGKTAELRLKDIQFKSGSSALAIAVVLGTSSVAAADPFSIFKLSIDDVTISATDNPDKTPIIVSGNFNAGVVGLSGYTCGPDGCPTVNINPETKLAEGGSVSITNGAAVTTSGYFSSAVAGLAPAGGVTIINSGALSASTAGADGNLPPEFTATSAIFAQSGLVYVVPIFETDPDTGEPVLNQDGLPVFVGNEYRITPGGDLSITNTGNLSVDGSNHNSGIAATSLVGGISITNGVQGDKTKGTIVMTGTGDQGDGAAIRATSDEGTISITNYANVTVADQSGIGAMSGGQNFETLHEGGSDVSITNAGDVKVGYGSGARDGGTPHGVGIGGVSTGGKVTIANTGKIESSGWYEAGIMAVSGFRSQEGGNAADSFAAPVTDKGGGIVITNSGEIKAGAALLNADAPNFKAAMASLGIGAQTYGSDIDITNSGKITAGGAGIAADATPRGFVDVGDQDGVSYRDFVNFDGGNVKITNSAAITLLRGGESAIGAYTAGVGTATIINNGVITSTHDNSKGLFAEVDWAWDSEDEGKATVKGSGAVIVSGADSYGIMSSSSTGDAEIDYTGRVTAIGAGGVGMIAHTEVGDTKVTVGGGAVGGVSASTFGVVAVTGNGDDVEDSGLTASWRTGSTNIKIQAGTTIAGGDGERSFGSQETATSVDGDGDKAVVGSGGILILGGQDNVIDNAGLITAANGLAIYAPNGDIMRRSLDGESMALDFSVVAGNLTVNNTGKILGDIEVDGEDNLVILNNNSGGVFTGNLNLAQLELENGVTAMFNNAGTYSPGGDGKIASTTIVGNFVQTASGRLVIDLDETKTTKSDFVLVTGTASLAGTINPNEINVNGVGAGEYKVLTAQGGTTLNGLTATDTVGYDYDVEKRGANDVYLKREKKDDVDLLVSEANSAGASSGNAAINGQAVANSVTAFENSGSQNGQIVADALRTQANGQALVQAVERLAPPSGDQQSNSTASGNASFSNSMLSCASRDQPYRFTKEDTCYYAKFTARKLERDATASSIGHDETGYEFIGGTQVNLGGSTRGGFAFGYENTNADSQSTTQRLGKSEGDRIHGGVVLKDQWGAFNAYLNLAASYGWYDHTRFVNLGGFKNAQGEQDVVSGLVKLRLSYLHEMGNVYLKPLVDVSATYIDLGGYTETGAGAFNLRVNSMSDWLFGVSPAVELGGEFADASGTLYRPFIRGGVTVYDKDNLNFSASFASAPTGVAGFNVVSELDNVFGDVGAGVQILTAYGTNVKFEYEGRFGEHTSQNAGSIKVTMPY